MKRIAALLGAAVIVIASLLGSQQGVAAASARASQSSAQLTAILGGPYDQDVYPPVGNGSFDWSVSAGTLPPGLTFGTDLNSDDYAGELSGIPTALGTYSFTVQAVTNTGAGGTYTIAIRMTVVKPAPLQVTPASLPDGNVGTVYGGDQPENEGVVVSATGGAEPYTIALSSGSLPPGLILNSSFDSPDYVTLGGQPTAEGTYTFTVTVTDGDTIDPQTASQTYTVTIGPEVPLEFTTTSLADAAVGDYYAQDILAAGGTWPIALTMTGGSLPDGLSFGTDGPFGSIYGTPTQAGTFTVSITATDSATPDANTVTTTLTLTVAKKAQDITFTAPASGQPHDWVTLSATGGGSGNPVVFSVEPGSSDVCHVSGTNGQTLNYDHGGDCVVDANQQGNDEYADATQVQRTITVKKFAPVGVLALSTGSLAWENEKALTVSFATVSTHGTPSGKVALVEYTTNPAVLRTLAAGDLNVVGKVTFRLSSATQLAPGTYWIEAIYAGDKDFEGLLTGALKLTVTKDPTTTAETLSAAKVAVGKEKTEVVTVTVTAKYAGPPSGTVTIKAGKIVVCKGKALTKGKVTCALPGNTTLRAGSYKVIATFTGAANWGGSTSVAKTLQVS
jgi:Bacterial Ig-like domain (group 3)/Putative Ig domain